MHSDLIQLGMNYLPKIRNYIFCRIVELRVTAAIIRADGLTVFSGPISYCTALKCHCVKFYFCL